MYCWRITLHSVYIKLSNKKRAHAGHSLKSLLAPLETLIITLFRHEVSRGALQPKGQIMSTIVDNSTQPPSNSTDNTSNSIRCFTVVELVKYLNQIGIPASKRRLQYGRQIGPDHPWHIPHKRVSNQVIYRAEHVQTFVEAFGKWVIKLNV